MTKILRICKHCGREFKVYPWRIRKGEAKFCSRNCSMSARTGDRHPYWKGGKVTRKCKQCGKEFGSHPSQPRKFCSRKCGGLWKSQNIRGKNHHKWKEKIPRKCKWCGKDFEIHPSSAQYGKFCSRDCYIQGISGENHFNWKGGTSFEPYPSEFNAQLKRSIRKRDKHICAVCEKEKVYCVHHINYDKMDNRFENLITLDRSCHTKTNFNRRFWQTVLSPIAIKRTALMNTG